MREYPDKEHTLALLADWQKHHAAVSKLMDGTKAVFWANPDTSIFDTFWRLFEAYTSSLSVEIGDLDEWLPWFYSDNNMGEWGMSEGYDGESKSIETLEHLYELIAESRKRG